MIFFWCLQVYIVYMGDRGYDESLLTQDLHHEILSNILGRFYF